MKSRLAFLALVLVCFRQCASADQITTGTLVFDCTACTSSPGFTSTLPTNGSFVYDNTTNQFLSVMVTWDGLSFDSFSVGSQDTPNTEQIIYQDLIGGGAGPLQFTFICSTVNLQNGPCERQFAAAFDGLPGADLELFFSSPGNVESANDGASGIVTTPEPSALLLLALGLVGLVLFSITARCRILWWPHWGNP